MKPTAKNFFRVSDGAVLYFEDYGEGDPIVLLHGFLGSTRFFCRNIEAMSKGHRLVLVDWRGHGLSSKSLQNLSMPRCADDIEELMEHLGLQNVMLMGWSIGASVVLSYWERYGEKRLRGLGIIDSVLYPLSDEPWNCHSLRDFNLDRLARNVDVMTFDHDNYCRGFARSLFKGSYTEEEIEWMTAEMKKLPPWIAFGLQSDFVHRDYLETLTRIRVPVLICCADSPILPDGIAMGRHYRDLRKGDCTLAEFPGEGHVMFYENPEKFNCAVLDFVK